ncbi:hypothetical protein N7456_006278 [Penicillium angulare]|uniref:Uncharacterized protein n=1 Tax=Penicillium angulare TaxID=116970 RepID=A0A9W9FHE1_9EURO|nr:hypothetical protein N7456_006278 [Penicillium angulare]
MRSLHLQQGETLDHVMTKQRVKPSRNFTRQLQIWDDVGYEIWEDEEKTVPKAPYKIYLEDRADFRVLKRKGLTGNESLAPLSLE